MVFDKKAYETMRYQRDKVKRLALQKKYRLENPDKVKQQKRKEYLKNKSKYLKRQNAYYKSNKETINAKSRANRMINKDILHIKRRAYYAKAKKSICIVRKKHYYSNREKLLGQKKQYYLRHKKEHDIKTKKYYSENKIKVRQMNKLWRNKNMHKIHAYLKELRHEPLYKIRRNLDSQLQKAINKNGESSTKLLSFNYQQLKTHLEKQFTTKMSWDNYGTYWVIDHKVPIAWHTTREQILKWAYRLENLQPLPIEINCSKSDRYVLDIQKNPINETIILLSAPKEMN